MNELVENLVELRAVFADERALGAVGGLTRFAVGVNLIRASWAMVSSLPSKGMRAPAMSLVYAVVSAFSSCNRPMIWA
ncbi:MAG: hypothetical protein ACLUFV_03650 [Acutalibacteraceae bacterium]